MPAFRIQTRTQITPAMAREIGLWAALIVLLGQHLITGPLGHAEVALSLVIGLGHWYVYRYLTEHRAAS